VLHTADQSSRCPTGRDVVGTSLIIFLIRQKEWDNLGGKTFILTDPPLPFGHLPREGERFKRWGD